MTTPHPLTAIAKIRPGEEDSLRDLISSSGNEIFKKDQLTHFANWVIINDPDNGPRLLWSSNYDGPLSAYLKQLMVASPELDKIWTKCEGYTGPRDFTRFVLSHSYQPQVYFIAFPGQTVQSIRQHIEIRQAIEAFLDRSDDARVLDRVEVERFVDLLAEVAARQPWWRGLLQTAPGAIHDSVFRLIIWAAERYGRWIVNHDYTSASSNIGQSLDLAVTDQNEMTNLIDVKPACLPHLRIALLVMQFLGKYAFPPGDLAGVKTIHFARWVLIDGGKRMLFQSKFDGSWENYMGDFVDKVNWGLDAIWTNTVGYPTGGMQDIGAFKRFIRDRQFPPILSYNAYPEETVLNIDRDLAIGNMLVAGFSREAVERWLAQL
jgi:hypothetical protein